MEKRKARLDSGRLALAAEGGKQEAEKGKWDAHRLNEVQVISLRQRSFEFSC